MKRNLFKFFAAIVILAMIVSVLPGWVTPVRAAVHSVSLTTLGSAYTQNFDTLSNMAGSTTNNLTISDWFMTETGGGARDNELYGVNDGASNSGDTYSYGTTGATDRALGGLLSGTLIPTYGASFANNTGSTIDTLAISYVGEEWRLGFAGRTDRLDFQYSLNATSLSDGSWTDVNALDFTTPDATAPTGAKNGNAAGYRASIIGNISGLNIPNGATFWIRWNDFDATNADDGLAIDDFSLTPNAGAPLPNITVSDVSLNEGNAGTTSFIFTVSLSAPAGAGGVTFDIATVDGTAAAPGDYTGKSLTGQMIPAGNSTYTFDVQVNGDTAPETNETFFVNVANVIGATVTDGQGQGTIVNDDAAPNLTINDVSLNEGNAGTTTFAFTVSLSAPAGTGGVTFDIATADGTAAAPGDYTLKALTGQTIPAGSSTYTFNVLVTGDTAPETNETFFVNVTNVTNAILTDGQGLGTVANDDNSLIHDIQGPGAASPQVGTTVMVEGVVIGDYQGATQLQGFFLQEEDADADADPATSEGIFVFCSGCPTTVTEGQRVRVTGAVSEFFNMTQITASTALSVVVTDAGNHLAEVTPSPISLPVAGDVDAFYEAREGMRVTFVDTLTVSEYYELAQYGQIELFQGGRPAQFTEQSAPSAAGYTAHLDSLDRRRVILDDDNNISNAPLTLLNGSQYVYYPHANGGFSVGTQGTDFFRGGGLVNGLTGVLHWSYAGTGSVDAWRIRPTSAIPAAFIVANPRPATPPTVGGTIKAVGMNLLNYFTTIDTTASTSTGPCGPSGTLDCRGADSVAELNRQRERASVVVCTLNADVYAFMELENTTASDTITDLLGAVNARCGGARPYAFVNTGGTLGTDAIRVALIYRTGVLSPVGSPLVDLDPINNRPPTAQTFEVVDAANASFGERFTVIANHLKSKSSSGSGADADAGDGQGGFNGTRVAQANRLLTWINSTVLPAAGDPDVLLLGDFNSYAREDPVTTLTSGGYTDLASVLLGPGSYSYLFDGQLGHLDYAFASSSLVSQVANVGNWHINADENPLFDYNDEIFDSPGEASFEEKPDGSALVPPRVVFQPASPYRASDHDPVLVGLNLARPIVSGSLGVNGAGASVAFTGGTPVTADGSGNYSFVVNYGWTGTITPSKTGYTFSLPSITVSTAVTANLPNQNFTTIINTYMVSGSLGANGAGASVAFTGGTPVTADGAGGYSFTVNYGWTGTITPSKTGYTFTLLSITISTPVTANLPGQDFTAASTNADLSNLVFSTGALSPAFAPGITTYTQSVANAVTSLTVTPTVANAAATVKVNGNPVVSGSASGPISLAVGPNTITTLVIAQDGLTTKPYTVQVTRAGGGGGGGGGGGLIPPVLTASDGLHTEKIAINWTASAGATYYLVYRSSNLDGIKIPLGGYRTTELGGFDIWANPGITYYYWVKACNESQCSDFSVYDSGWQGLISPVISASDGLYLDKVLVSWTESVGATSYFVYRSISQDGIRLPANGYFSADLGGNDIWAASGVTYYYWVKACNGSNCSPFSESNTGWR